MHSSPRGRNLANTGYIAIAKISLSIGQGGWPFNHCLVALIADKAKEPVRLPGLFSLPSIEAPMEASPADNSASPE
ncbi:uncharacterized protein LAJ45_05900 [Morchella importuna]|uniref:uncharacterized protein n=1 Tax=Morchella importuna TaxID=1174673 RepID=UPI001E8DD880|nr:uncharacterized protein LAJ45_05900 [Morchella importuna]KAH8150214.1 hypothetical protein LAJ45_05900 [Morchella importuna]